MSCIYFLLCQARTARGWRQSRGQLGISSTIPHALGSAVGAGKAVNVERTRLQATPPSNPAFLCVSNFGRDVYLELLINVGHKINIQTTVV